MELVTATAFAPGSGERRASRDQTVVLPRTGLIAVADSPGHSEHGPAATRLALGVVRSHIERNEDILARFRRNPTPMLRKRILTIIEDAFARAAKETFAFARRRPGVEVTLDVALLLGHEAFIGHVGDGRVYLVRRGLVHQLTVDHSGAPIQAPLQGEGEVAPKRHTRALGPEPRVQVESLCMELVPDDRFIASTAHLYRSIPEAILHTRLTSEHLQQLGRVLVGETGGGKLIAAFAQLGSGVPFTPDSAQARLAILAPMPLFAHCNERELRAVAQATRPRRFPRSSVIFEQGEPGTELFLVISGSVEIVKHGRPMALLGPGSNFGEMAMLDEPQRSATAVAATDCELMVIPREAFFALLKGDPMLAVKVLWNLTLRLSAHLRVTSDRLATLERPPEEREP